MEGYVLYTFGIKALRQFIAETGFIIICCQATAGRCAIVGFADGPCIQVTCMLKNIEEFLNSCNYYRCHYSYLVNISYITRVDYDERRIYFKEYFTAELCVRNVTEMKFIMANRDNDLYNSFRKNLSMENNDYHIC